MTTGRNGTLPERMRAAFVPRRSELRRPSDRAETVARWVALALLTAALPLLLAVGSARAQDLRDSSALARATSHPVAATITRVVPRAGTSGGVPSGAVDITATWVAPDSTARTVVGTGWRGARVGDPWSAWADEVGHQVPPPRSDSEATLEGVLLALWAFLAVGVGLAGTLTLLHRILDRRRMRGWDEDLALFRLGRSRGVTG
jgi:hypothetical protein